MKKYLLSKEGTFYKANLHCHSTVSDGQLTPEELKMAYMEQGYSIIAYTDHNVFIPHPELTDAHFLPLNGYEIDITEDGAFEQARTCHLCFIALDPRNTMQVCYHRSKYVWGNALEYQSKLKFDESQPDFERAYTPECVNEIIKTGREQGFFVTYNYPAWSLESKDEYGKYTGMNAMEICNYCSMTEGYPDYNEKEYDDMLRGGERIYCIATDDNHNSWKDSFGGFTMIKAPKLEYEAVTNALLTGNFYASQGPEIHDLWYEDGKVHITCSPAQSVVLNTGRRSAQAVFASENKLVCEASFDVQDGDVYVRITVTDSTGKHANTNAYFVDELMK